MSVPSEPFLVIDDLTGGLNTTLSPLAVAENECTAAENVEWVNRRMPSKRNGTAVVHHGTSGGGYVLMLATFIPRAGIPSSELWAMTYSAAIGHISNTTLVGVTPDPVDTPDTGVPVLSADTASFNNKFFMAWKTTGVDRLHVWDGTTLRRVGFATAAAPTAANTGSGSYAATVRYYKVSYARLSGSTVISRGSLSSALSFTPSGSGTAARVTKPATISEGETHWELWASSDNVNFYLLAQTVVGTTTYDDSAVVTTYSAGVLAPATGTFTAPGSVKYLTVHDNRLFMAGSWITAAYGSRVWWTPISGETGEADDERVPGWPVGNYIDINADEDGSITGLARGLGSVFVWKANSFYKMVSTGDADVPYLVVQISDSIGCVRQRTIVSAEDENGSPAVYWLGRNGAYRYGADGVQFLGGKIREIWATVISVDWLNYSSHGVYYSDKQQIWWFVPYTAGISYSYPTIVLVFNVRTGAWWTYTGDVSKVWCSAMFSDTLGTGVMSTAQKPYTGFALDIANTDIFKADTGSADVNSATTVTYRGLVRTKAFPIGGYGRNGGITEAQVYAKVLANQSIELQLIRDFGLEARASYCNLNAADTETRVMRKFEDAAVTSAQVVQFQLGDQAAVNSGAWELDAFVARYRDEEAR